MTEQYTPTTEEVLGILGSHLYEYGAECDMNLPGNSPDEIVNRWLAEVERAAAEKAGGEGAEAAFYNPEIRGLVDYPDDNPYRKAV